MTKCQDGRCPRRYDCKRFVKLKEGGQVIPTCNAPGHDYELFYPVDEAAVMRWIV
jgi:uncharacterized protein (DUF983 family)